MGVGCPKERGVYYVCFLYGTHDVVYRAGVSRRLRG